MQNRIAIMALALAPFATLAGQSRSAASCWLRPAPTPACSSFLVTEASAEFRLTNRVNETNPRYMLGVGYMQNVAPASSVGGILAWDVGRGWAKPARAELRYRRWLTGAAVDVSGGVVQRGLTVPGTTTVERVYGPSAGVSVEKMYIALDARGELLRGAGQTRGDVYLGARTTSLGAPVAVLAGLALIVAVVAVAGAS